MNEYLVGRLGRLVEAPVCEITVVEIGTDLAGAQYSPGRFLAAGMASGSMDVANASPLRTLEHRLEDDNQRRHAGVYTLYDWCWGADDQWLYDWSDQYRTHSHDHGFFLPGGPNWTEADLQREVDSPHQLGVDPSGTDPSALEHRADLLDSMTAEVIRGMLRTVPSSWPVGQRELEVLGWFLERRAHAVAERLRSMAMTVRGGSRT